ncbi:hypothetical protein N7457_003272 [Penicillium paradoxum]|uniref:uncharacterized protein n=1 Tax=Penicillium paradoxum TaxID=176176 RepID=UPI002548B881|nr:uncharacterized protein N7457_003272 [Penicillium paradoxum]KAJ5788282.1 hypothetical protein N7457_003272 [Penicillium paradoxum]
MTPPKGDQSITLTGDDIQFVPVTITAGRSMTATDASSTSTDDAASSVATSPTSTGGLPRMTANSGVALEGAAAVIVAAPP